MDFFPECAFACDILIIEPPLSLNCHPSTVLSDAAALLHAVESLASRSLQKRIVPCVGLVGAIEHMTPNESATIPLVIFISTSLVKRLNVLL